MTEFPKVPSGCSLKGALERLRGSGITIAHVGIYDLMGTFRERRLQLDDVPSVFDDGGTFVNVLPQWDAGEKLFGSGPFLGENVLIDPASIRPYPFEPNACMMVADYTGRSAAYSSRQLLANQIKKADAMGFSVNAAIESEFFILEEDATTLRETCFSSLQAFAKDNRCWSGESAATHASFVADLCATLKAGDINLISLVGELGPGCFESTLRHTSPMRAAEDHLALKMFIKAFCRQRGLTASFMAQLGGGLPGLSQHPHLSLFDKTSGDSAFVGCDGEDMSLEFKYFVAGILKLVPEAMALTHHTTNSYRRIAPGNWAPKSASWGRQNYSSAVRVVTKPDTHCRLEYRLPGADANPFLSLGYVLGAGLWGIEVEAELPKEFCGGGPDEVSNDNVPLPHDLFIAADRLDSSDSAKSIWGEEFVTHFIAAIRSEEAVLRRETSAAERARYLEVV